MWGKYWVKLKERTKIVAGSAEFLTSIIMMTTWFVWMK